MSKLTVGEAADGKVFRLPLELVTSTQAILARKRSGKSYTASVQAEEMLKAKQQVVVIDPTSAWYGLKSSADGQGAGYPVVVFGGDHKDADLDYRAGRAMATAVVDRGFSAIFDVGSFHTEEQIQFVTDFCSELLRINRNAMHVFMDEADTFAPQVVRGDKANKCLGTVSRLVKQGGIKGVGFTMITQRPASINKDVLSQVDMLTILRMGHPLDIKAATDWLKSETTVEFAKRVEAELPRLPIGVAFVASAPLGIAERVSIRTRTTFNSGATPKPGERKVEPKVLAQVDIEKLGAEIAASVKRAREESPEFLKKKVAELEAQIAKGGTTDMGVLEEIQAMHVELDELRPMREKAREADEMRERLGTIKFYLAPALQSLKQLAEVCDVAVPLTLPNAFTMPEVRREFVPSIGVRIEPLLSRAPAAAPPAPREGNLESRILRSLAEFASIGRQSIPRETLSAWAEARGGHYSNTLGKMRTAGLIDYPSGGTVGLTAEGRKVAPKIDTLPTPAAFFERVVAQAGGGLAERIMRRLRKDYPDGLSRDELSEQVDARGGHYSNTLGSMRTAGFLEYPSKGAVRLQDWTVMQ